MSNLRFSFIGSVCLPAVILSVFYLGTLGCNQTNCVSWSSDAPATTSKNAPHPLIEATLANDEEQVELLLQNGAEPNLVYNTNTALTYSARDGSTKIANLLINYGADVNWIDGEGVTPLILASLKNHIDIVKLLLNHQADQTVRDQWNRNALDYALRRGKADPIVRLLETTQ